MQDLDWKARMQTLAECFGTLITFAEQEDDFVLAAKLDDARAWFTDRYSVDAS